MTTIDGATAYRPCARKFTGLLLGAGIAGAALVVAAQLALHGTGAEGWQMATRYTARFSVWFFLAAFLAGPLARVFPGEATRALLRERRGVGLAFFGAHTVHLVALSTLIAMGGRAGIVTILGGGLGYALIFAMAATSNDWSVTRLGAKNWKLLHTIGIYYIWAIFANSYAGRALEPDAAPVHLLLAGAVVAALLFRLGAPLIVRARRHSA